MRTKTLQLRRGTTGFRHVDDPPLPSTDAGQFRADLFHIAQFVGAEVVHAPRRNPTADCSFFDALLRVASVPIRVLLNITYPLVAFSQDWTTPGSRPEFIDQPALASGFAQYPHYTVLSAATLDSPVTDTVTAQLATAELEQLDYWKPSRIGDIVFNYWD